MSMLLYFLFYDIEQSVKDAVEGANRWTGMPSLSLSFP